MILAFFWIVIFTLLLLFGVFAWLLRTSRRGNSVLAEDTYGLAHLKLLDSVYHHRLATSGGAGRRYRRFFSQGALEMISREIEELVRLSNHPNALIYLLCYRVILGLTLLKVKYFPGQDDIRPVIGVEILLVRAMR